MRTAKEMVFFDKTKNNFQLKGTITFEEFKFVTEQSIKLDIFNERDTNGFWDYVVVRESLKRDRPSVFTRFNRKLT